MKYLALLFCMAAISAQALTVTFNAQNEIFIDGQRAGHLNAIRLNYKGADLKDIDDAVIDRLRILSVYKDATVGRELLARAQGEKLSVSSEAVTLIKDACDAADAELAKSRAASAKEAAELEAARKAKEGK